MQQIGYTPSVRAVFSRCEGRRHPIYCKCVRSDSGGEFDGLFNDLCRNRDIKQGFTQADSLEFDGVAERAIGLVESVAILARIHADMLYIEDASDRLLAESSRWVADALNRPSTK